MLLRIRKFATLAAVMLLAATMSIAADAPPKSGDTAKAQAAPQHTVHRVSKKSHKKRVRGQKAIDGDRVREIQQALIREHYLKGQASGKWDDTTQAAMRRYQAEQGWQTKLVPDSRALIRLGLGPDQEHLLNPESAMTTEAHVGDATKAHVRAVPSSSSTSGGTVPGVNSMPASSVSAPSGNLPGNPSQ